MAARLKKGDQVVVMAGKDKTKTGIILEVRPGDRKAVVEGVNVATRHRKASSKAEAARVPVAMPIDLSNLALLDPELGVPTRVGFAVIDGKKVRIARKSGARIDD